MKLLPITQFGNPILRQAAMPLGDEEIRLAETQSLIDDMFYTLRQKKLGVALAAPQVGQGKAVVVVLVQPTKHRPKAEPLEAVWINPEIVRTFGRRTQQWEGCISGGKGNAGLFAKVPRYRKLEIKYMNQGGEPEQHIVSGLVAQIAQHEIDHLHGNLFVDRVRDTKTYTTYSEYMKLVRKKRSTLRK